MTFTGKESTLLGSKSSTSGAEDDASDTIQGMRVMRNRITNLYGVPFRDRNWPDGIVER